MSHILDMAEQIKATEARLRQEQEERAIARRIRDRMPRHVRGVLSTNMLK